MISKKIASMVLVGVSLTMFLGMMTKVFADKPLNNQSMTHPTTIDAIIKELNEDVVLTRLGFSFTCESSDAQYPVLLFHTGQSYSEIDHNWMRFGKLTQMISNNWRIVTGCGIVVGLDLHHKMAFVTDMNGAFHMTEVPTNKKEKKPEKNKERRIKMEGVYEDDCLRI
jgi:hypothetical protein